MRVLGVHHGVGEHDANVPGSQLRGDVRDADLHHGFVVHAGAVLDRCLQATGIEHDAGSGAARVLARRSAVCGPLAVLAVCAHVWRRYACG